MDSLHARVERDGPLDVQNAVGWAIRLCKRIEELHRLGVAHGGLSAHCVLTASAAARDRGTLGDVREAAMRPAYHSPERLAGGTISTDDDTWAVAVTLYFLLTGAMPFAGATAPEILAQIGRGGAAPLAVFDAGDDRLQGILDAFLEADLGRRSRSLNALRTALERWRGPGGALGPLDDGDDDFDDDDDDDNVATVMRDFSDVRAQLEALQKAQPGGGHRPGALPASAAVPLPPRARPPAAPGAPRPAPGAARPPRTPPASPEAGSSPGRAPFAPAPTPGGPVPDDIDDDDEEVATMLMETEGTEIEDAIREALAKRAAIEAAARSGDEPAPRRGDAAGPPPGWPGPEVAAPSTTAIVGGASAGAVASPIGAAGPAAPMAPSHGASPPAGATLPAGGAAATGASPPGMGGPVPPGFGGLPPGAVPGVGPQAVGEPAPRSGIRTALIVSTVLLVLVVIWIALLLLERAGLFQLPV